MSIIFGILIGLVILTVIVGLHELGHARAAIRNGVNVKEFGLGFPPAAIKLKAKTNLILPKGTPILINWIPLGGYVKLQGEHDSDSNQGDYGAASFWAKTQILFAGVLANWIVAVVLFSILAIIGLPKMIPNQFYISNDARISGGEVIVTKVSENLPATKSGIKIGDQIVKINEQKISSSEDISKISRDNRGKKIKVDIVREGKAISKTVDVRSSNDDKQGFVGLASDANPEKIHSTWSAPIVGLGITWQLSVETFNSLGKLVANSMTGLVQKFSSNQEIQKVGDQKLEDAGKNLAGPISILGILFPTAAEAGIETVILLTALISLSLACMNILPIPVLDGGRWFIMFVSRKVLGKVLSAEEEEKIISWGVYIILMLAILTFVLDIGRFF